jgi:hypothetical protein
VALSYVGGFATSTSSDSTPTISLTSLTGGSGSAPIAGDLVIVGCAIQDTTDRNLTISTSDYTEIADLYANGTATDSQLIVGYKKMSGTPDTDVTLSVTATSSVTVISVWRGADQTTPIDVATTTATGTGTGRPDAPSITPTTAGAVVVVIGHGTDPSAPGVTALSQSGSELSNFIHSEVAGVGSIATGSFNWTSGAFNPVAWTGGTTSADASWTAASVAIRPASITAYTLTADAGSFSLTGAAANLYLGHVLAADPGAFALTGADASLFKGFTLAADGGTFALTGADATLNAARRLPADSGSFSVVGTDASLLRGYALSAGGTAFAFAGSDALLQSSRRLVADAGAFAVAAADAALNAALRLDAGGATFAFAGADAALSLGYRLSCESGSFTLTLHSVRLSPYWTPVGLFTPPARQHQAHVARLRTSGYTSPPTRQHEADAMRQQS